MALIRFIEEVILTSNSCSEVQQASGDISVKLDSYLSNLLIK